MLAMHYAIQLKDPGQVAAVRARAAERGPLFDGMPGLGCKLFLVDAVDPCYATFYLWREPDAALGFLQGPFFQALSDTFGRPEVKLLLTTATDLPFAVGETLALDCRSQQLHPQAIRSVDPRSGDILALGPATGSGRRFQVMYRAVGKL